MSVKKFKSDPLEEADAIKFHNDFVTKHPARPTTPTHDFGKAICIKLGDLKDYICEAEKALKTAGVPEENRGIAMYFMINQHGNAGYRMGKPSIMFVTSAYTEDGNGRVTALSNQIEKVPLTNGEETPFVNLKGDINHDLNFYNFHDRHP